MESAIFAGLLIMGYLANQNNNTKNSNKDNAKINFTNKQKKEKKQSKEQQIKQSENGQHVNSTTSNGKKNNNIMENDVNSIVDEAWKDSELNGYNDDWEIDDNNKSDNEPCEYNLNHSLSNVNIQNDNISGRSKVVGKQVKSKLTNENVEFVHNNMQPFFGSSVKQNMELDKPSRELNLFTGGQDLKQPKKEVGPLFENSMQNIFGMQNYSTEYQSNINQSLYKTNTLPFKQEKVGPGIGLDYDSGPTGGFHQDTRKYEMPKSIDELRAKNNPKISYKGKLIKGKKEIKRDAEYNFTKHKEIAMEVNRNQYPTSGVNKEVKRSQVYIKDNNRRVSKELMGPAGSTNSKEVKRQKHRPSDKLMLEVDTTRNIAGDPVYDYDRDAFKCMETKREEQAPQQFKKGLYMANLLKALIPTSHYEDEARRTIKETTEDKTELLNLKGQQKMKMYNKDPARTTIRETTENNVKDIMNIKLYNKLPNRIKQKIRTTLKETLLDNNHSGYITVENKKTQLRNLEKLKTTLKETLLRDSELLNMIAGYRGTKQFEDIAKLTHKETYANNYSVGGAAQNRNDGYKSANMEMVETNRQTTSNHEYTGIADRENATGYATNEFEAKETNKESYADKDYYGAGIGDKEMMSYEDMYNATINELKEKTLKGRAPTKVSYKKSVSSKDINMDIKCDLLRQDEEPRRKTLIHNNILDKNSIVSTSNKKNAIDDIIKFNESKKTADITQQLNQNPLSISIV